MVNEIIQPKATNCIVIGTPDGDLTEESEVAATFKKFFVDKIVITCLYKTETGCQKRPVFECPVF